MAKTGYAKHLIVISYDAFSQDNWEAASRLPNLSKLIKKGAYSTRLKSIYPTLTYVVHSTMVTGVYPNRHGVLHNNPFQPFVPEKEQSWYWFRKDIKVATIYDVVKKHGMKSAGFLWPVTGKASIHYNIPEIRAIKKENQILKSLVNGSPLFSIGLEMKFGRYRKGIEQPYLDDFTTMCAVDTIKRKKPNLLLMHLIDLDDAKHLAGTDSSSIEQVLIRMDKRLGDITQAVQDAGISENTVFLIVGDHGQLNVRYKVSLNQILKDKGLIYEEKGEMKWRAFIQGAGGSAYVHIRPGDNEAKALTETILAEASREECYGIEAVYHKNELTHFHMDSSIDIMLEAKKGYCFDDSLDGPIVLDLDERGIRHATHGYSPEKPGYSCNLLLSGDCINQGYQLGAIEMVDIAPTMARILGVSMEGCDGRVLTEVF